MNFHLVKYPIRLICLILVLSACMPSSTPSTPPVLPTNTPALPLPIIQTTRAPDVQKAFQAFLDAWKADKYDQMYALLTRISRDAISAANFSARYRDVAANLGLQSIDYEILSSLTNPTSAQVAYRVRFKTILADTFSREMLANLTLEDGNWRVQWEDGLIMPELRGGNRFVADYKIPARGNIYDRAGTPIAQMADAVSLGVIPGNIDEEKEGELLQVLSRLTGKTVESIKASYEKAGATWYIAIGEAAAADIQRMYGDISGIPGLVLGNFRARYYYDGGVAPHAVGYVLSISKENLEEYRRRGYRGDEKVGDAGLEKWAEEYLAGKRGISLYIANPQGQIVTRLSQSEAQPAQSVTTTLDRNLQLEAQKAMSGFRGAIVVLERDTGRVLAMASSPSFDPNLFEPTNRNNAVLSQTLSDPNSRLLNRATQGGGYPLGSVFKIITMAAALETGIFKESDTYNCGHTWTELPGLTLYDWTYEKQLPPSGKLNLPEGLMRSCNPWFWHIGLELYRQNQPKAVSEMARAFGLGKATGIQQVAEEAGKMPDPGNEGDAVQLAIGQGTMLVTPLQVANFIAAIGNGGALLRPQLVEKIAAPDGTVVYEFKKEEIGRLPLSAENLKLIQTAMRSVVSNTRGTAYNRMTGLTVPVYGKTGTAQTSAGKPHAWFAGYTAQGSPDRPDIAVAVIAENAGEGSDIAAPIFRRIVEVYFFGKPARLYPWESKFNVTRTPTPPTTPTPSSTLQP